MTLKKYVEKPIGKLLSRSGWEGMPIIDSGEPLINLKQLNCRQIHVESIYNQQGLKGSLPECYVREGLAIRLREAVKKLPKGYRIIVYDAWRPLEVQQEIFNTYRSELKNQNPEFSDETIFQMTSRFVAQPNDKKEAPAVHATGGAIDLTIEDEAGQTLYMGSDFDEFSNASNTTYFEEERMRRELSINEEVALRNRRLLFHIMIEQGFTNFTEEWWHYDYGNQYWATILKKENAIYGLAEL